MKVAHGRVDGERLKEKLIRVEEAPGTNPACQAGLRCRAGVQGDSAACRAVRIRSEVYRTENNDS